MDGAPNKNRIKHKDKGDSRRGEWCPTYIDTQGNRTEFHLSK